MANSRGGFPYAKNQERVNNPLKTFQTPNMALGQNVIRTNLSSLHTSLRVAQILSVTAGYSQMKKDSVQAVLIQRYADCTSLRGSVTNYPNTIGSVQRLPDDIGLVQHSNHMNDVHEVDCLVLRCLRLISLCNAVTINCAVLSPSFFKGSIASTTSCGTRADSFCDFALVLPVAISVSIACWWVTVYTKNKEIKVLTWGTLEHKVGATLNGFIVVNNNAPVCGNTTEASNHNVKRSNTMAMYKSTQTHPKFKWRFFSCQQSRYFTVEARSEQEARSMLPDAPCLFSARIRQGVNHA